MSGTGLTLRVHVSGDTPAYRQIADGLRAHLVEGRLKPDETLPTVRDLATELGVHFNTVAEAYRILADEGWLDLKRRRGARVLARKTPRPNSGKRAGFAQRMRELVATMRAEGVTEEEIRNELNTAIEGQ